MAAEPALRPLMIRAPGYLSLCVGVLLTFLIVSVGAFVDPSLDGTRDPDWMFWVWVSGLTALLLRAPFVGLLIDGVRVVRRGWVRKWTHLASEVKAVRSQGYSGNLNRGSESRTFKMLELKMVDGRVVEVPEVTGSAASTARRVAEANGRRGLNR